MAYYTYTKDPIGVFVEKEHGNYFEYSHNEDHANGFNEDFKHKVWVGGEGICGCWGWRYATVMKTRAYVAVDKDEFGLPGIEKWYLKNNKKYVINA